MILQIFSYNTKKVGTTSEFLKDKICLIVVQFCNYYNNIIVVKIIVKNVCIVPFTKNISNVLHTDLKSVEH